MPVWQPVEASEATPVRQFTLHSPSGLPLRYHFTRETTELELPHPDGGFVRFRWLERSVMPDQMARKYPGIRTFRVTDLQTGRRAALTWTGSSLSAMVLEGKQAWVVQTSSPGAPTYRSAWVSSEELTSLSCGVNDELEQAKCYQGLAYHSSGLRSAFSPLRQYRLALTCTGEYAQREGGTVESVLGAMTGVINNLNLITEAELAIRLQLVDRNDELIYLDPETDPFTDAENAPNLLNEVAPAINAVLSPTDYDVGHVFTDRCDNGIGGIASLNSVCTNRKTQGVTCRSTSLGVTFVMAHELGHQFGAFHSFNYCPPNSGAITLGEGFEPGGGSTIMAYAGACGSGTYQSRQDFYYHNGSLEDIFRFTREGAGSGCVTEISTKNIAPQVSLSYENGFFIPVNTPFELQASGFDENGDPLTYCWEQYNTGPSSPLGEPQGEAPLFRSYRPTADSIRIFPRLSAILANQNPREEFLPTYSRDLSFRCTVRDNNTQVGAAAWAQVDFRATDQAGPFLVAFPNAAADSLRAGEEVSIQWEVANTEKAPVNCKTVNIRLSIDGGNTYPLLLAAGTPNDGSALVTLPDVSSQQARIKIEAAGNIFFDLSNADFRIAPVTQAGFALRPVPESIPFHCLPDSLEFELRTEPIGDLNSAIIFDFVDGLPEGLGARFSKNPVLPGESTTLRIGVAEGPVQDSFSLVIRASAEGDTSYREISFNTLSTDFSDLSLHFPDDGTSGLVLSTELAWNPAKAAERYTVQIADEPGFDQGLLEEAFGITDTTYVLSSLLENNTLYYWRVLPENDCGPGMPVRPFTFHTVNTSCTPYAATDTPINISGSGRPTIESHLQVNESGIIADLNVPLIQGNFQPVNSLRISLISPAGTEAVLFDQNCGNTINLSLGFDDEAPEAIQCPPDDGIVFRPIDSLSIFNGEDIQGEWTLRVEVVEPGFGASGALSGWSLEFCAGLEPLFPQLLVKDTLRVPPGQTNTITTSELLVTDEDNSSFELKYTLVELPKHGQLRIHEQLLEVGGVFTQLNIERGDVLYTHDNSPEPLDQFLFVLEDGTGGFLPVEAFDIRIQEGVVVGVEETLPPSAIRIFPNPAGDWLRMETSYPEQSIQRFSLHQLDGRLLEKATVQATSAELPLNGLPGGIYILRVWTEAGVAVRKLVKE